MQRIPVQSSNIRSVGYDPDEGLLEVEFMSGSIYEYSGVPQRAYEAFAAAHSHGRHHRERIANAYPFRRVK